MSNIKQTDSHNWKKRMSELDNLPGEPASKDLLWERLHERLEKKSIRKKPLWHWAAACFLLLSGLAFLISKKHTAELPVKEIVQQKQTSLPNSILIKKENIAVIANSPAENKLLKQHQQKNIAQLHNNRPAKLQPAITTVVTTANQPVEIAAPVLQPDTNMLMVTKAPTKLKLSVVNINELDAPSEQAFTAKPKKHNDLRIKFGKEIFLSKSAESRQVIAARPNIKIHLSN